MWTKLPNTCAPHRPQSQCHRIPYALPHSPSTLPFFLFLFPSSLTLYMAAAGGALLFVPVAGKGRSGLHLSFASCYHFSHLCPPPSLPLLLFTPPTSVFLPFCLWHTAIGLEWSEVRKGEGGTHARHWTPDPSTRWTFSCRLPISSDTLSVFPIITLVSLPFLGQEHKG